MASPSDPTDSCRDLVAGREILSRSPSLIEKSSVERRSVSVENANSVASKALNLESTQNLHDQEEPEASIEGSRNEEDDMDAVSSSYYRRGGGPKRKKPNLKKRKFEEKSKEKLEVLLKTLKPVPFLPGKTLDFSRHEKLLKTLGLWDFLHLEFDQNIRQDLIANLVAYYTPEGRCSYVNGIRIKISRADLARALKLPKKKDIVITEEEKEILDNDESIKFIEEILSDWVILQRADMWIVPAEVFEWGKHIKQKQLEKIDWADLLWFMVEKELKAETPLGDCFFASHLQLLIKSQKEDLLIENSKLGDHCDDVKEVNFMVKSPKDDCLEVKDEDDAGADLSKGDEATESKEENCVEEHMLELNLGQESVSEMVSEEERGPVEGEPMDVEENKKEEDEKWPCNEEAHAGAFFLRRCDFSNAREGEEESKSEGRMEMGEDERIEDVGEEETEEDKEKNEGGYPFFPSTDSFNGVGQDNLMLGDASPIGYGSGLQIHGNSTGGDFLTPRVDMRMAMGSGSSSFFGNGNNRREIDHENDITYHSHNPGNKRLRTEEPSWEEKPPPVEMCMEQIEYWAEKARLSFAEKDREREQSVINQQYLMNELQSKAEMIEDLQKNKIEEQQRKDLMIYRLESELRMMANIVEGYRKALKATKKASNEHRKHCPLRDEPVYKDVKGSGGLVLCTAEIEKLRLKQETEDKLTRAVIKREINEFDSFWVKMFERHMESVELVNGNLIEAENEVKNLRETLLEKKNQEEATEVAPATEET